MMFKKTLIAAAVFAFGGLASTTMAGTATNTFKVSLTVDATCAVDTAGSDITLGPVNAGATTTVQSGTFKVNCSNNTPYNVGLAPAGSSTDGTGTLKGTSGNTATIAYALYQDANGNTAWGNTATSSSVGNGKSGAGTGMATANAASFIAYANATGSTDVKPDTYSDTVTVNVNF